MSRRFLTNIDLEGNELVNGVIHNLTEDPENGEAGQIYFNTTDQVLKIYNGVAEEWQAVGSEEFIGDVVSNLVQSGSGIFVDYDDENDSLTISNTGVLSIDGTEGEIVVSASAGDVTIGLSEDVNIVGFLSVGGTAEFSDDVEVEGSLTVKGDLNVEGTVNAIDRTEINLEDNTIRLNSNLSASATPTENAEIIVERGAEPNAALRWNETLNQWELGFEDGSYEAIIATNDLTEDVEDIVGNLIVGGEAIAVNYEDANGELFMDVVLSASGSYLLTAFDGLSVDIETLQTQLIADSFTRKAAANVGNGVNFSFALVHGFDTRDVTVNVYDNATFDTVEVDVVRTDSDTVTVTFAEAPTTNAYRVVIVG
jgi:hypothetical protein